MCAQSRNETSGSTKHNLFPLWIREPEAPSYGRIVRPPWRAAGSIGLCKAEFLGQMRAVLAFAWLTAFPGQSPRFRIGNRFSHLDAVSAVLAVRLFAKNWR